VVDIDPVYTLGKIAQNRQKIIADLKKRNLLDKNKEKIFPQLPLKVGLITSLNSAAFADFTNELDSSGFGFKVFACGAHMQGKLVEPDVVKALDYFNKLEKEELDVIVVTRGGGSTADLSYFDSQKIAEKIASLDFPVVAAVGHQINTTIIDLMAHTSCKTPTAAGQCLVEKVQVFLDGLTELERSVLEKSEEILEDKKQGLQNTALRFDSALTGYFQIQKELLLEKKHSIVNLSKMHLQDQKNKIINIGKDIGSFSKRLLEDSRNYLSHIDEKIKLLDPKNILKRGYSVTYLKNKAIKSIDDLEIGDKIKTVFYKGWVESNVKDKG
jgi:exodeoxyribonuclease VII large subunit